MTPIPQRRQDRVLGTYVPDSTRRTGDLLNAWAGVNVLAAIAPQLPEVTATAVLDYLSTAAASVNL